MLGASHGGVNPDAEWWVMRVLPTLDGERYGIFFEQGEPYDQELPCGSPPEWPIPQHYYYPNSPRDFAGRGHEEATQEWLALGPFETDLDYWQCVFELNPDRYRHSFAWNGGYDTPFWYAVHAYRTQDPSGEIGDGLRPLLPGPPVDVPELRAQILSTINCQPEGLRVPEAYGNADLWIGADGQYLPPELRYILPDLEPPFRRVED